MTVRSFNIHIKPRGVSFPFKRMKHKPFGSQIGIELTYVITLLQRIYHGHSARQVAQLSCENSYIPIKMACQFATQFTRHVQCHFRFSTP